MEPQTPETIDTKKIRKTMMMRAASNSSPNALAGAIAQTVRDGFAVEISTIGAGALNQTIKATAIANIILEPEGVMLFMIPRFEDIIIDGENRTVIKSLLLPICHEKAMGAIGRVTMRKQKLSQ